MGILAKEEIIWIEENTDSYDYIKMRNVYLSKNKWKGMCQTDENMHNK